MSSLKNLTIFKSFEEIAAQYPQKAAVYFLGTKYSYVEVLELVERFAAALAQAGLGKGDRIIMYIPNSIQFVVSWLGILRLGAVAVPITPIYTSSDLKYIANDTGARAVICSDRNYGYVNQIINETAIERVIVPISRTCFLGGKGPSVFWLTRFPGATLKKHPS